MNEKSKNQHEGHRIRLTNLVENAGIENLSEIQAVEFFLTYIFPRSDVNPLAHELLNKYGNFANIIDAKPSDLARVPGLGEQSAKKIHLFKELIELYSSSKMSKKLSLENTKEFLDFLEELLLLKGTEDLFMFAIDNKLRMIAHRKFGLDMVRSVGINPMEIYEFVSSTHPAYLIFAHNHPAGSAIASPDDHEAVKFINQLLENFECKLFDSFIVGEDGIYSEKQDAFVRKFTINDAKTKKIQ